jgi:hypothetical protein
MRIPLLAVPPLDPSPLSLGVTAGANIVAAPSALMSRARLARNIGGNIGDDARPYQRFAMSLRVSQRSCRGQSREAFSHRPLKISLAGRADHPYDHFHHRRWRLPGCVSNRAPTAPRNPDPGVFDVKENQSLVREITDDLDDVG